MTVGALVAALGALFLGEYEFNEMVPILVGPMLALIVAEIVVSLGGHRSKAMAAVLAVWSASAVLLAGSLDANGNESIKAGAYLSAGLAALAAGFRGNDWFKARRKAARRARAAQRPAPEPEARPVTTVPTFAPSDWLAEPETPVSSGPARAVVSAPRPERVAPAPHLRVRPEVVAPDASEVEAPRPVPRSGPVSLRPRTRPRPADLSAGPAAPHVVPPVHREPTPAPTISGRRSAPLVAPTPTPPAPVAPSASAQSPVAPPATAAPRNRSRAEAKAEKAMAKALRAQRKAEDARRAAAGLPPVDRTDPAGTGEGWPEDPAGWGEDLRALADAESWGDDEWDESDWAQPGRDQPDI